MVGVNLSDPRRLREIAEALTRLFYCLLAVALLAAVFGSPGSGFLLLLLGGCAHVARVGVEGLAGIGIERSRPQQRPRPRRRPAAPTASPSPRRARTAVHR